MLFNVLSCFVVILISVITYAGILTFADRKGSLKVNEEEKTILMNLLVWGTLIVFMWVMSLNYWWR